MRDGDRADPQRVRNSSCVGIEIIVINPLPRNDFSPLPPANVVLWFMPEDKGRCDLEPNPTT